MAIVNHDLKFGNQVDRFKSQLSGAHLAIKNLIPVYEARGVIYIKRGALGFLVSKKSGRKRIDFVNQGRKKMKHRPDFQNTYGFARR